MPSTLLISGASGFIGSVLVRHFSDKGWKLVSLTRRPGGSLPHGITQQEFDLRHAKLPERLFDGIEVFIHAAYAKQEVGVDAFHTNVDSARKLLAAAECSGVRQRIFFSSLSALPYAASEYGKQKYAIEKLFGAAHGAVVRPGLVLGNGGLFAAMLEHLRLRHTVPLIGGGCQPLQTVFIDDLVAAVDRIVADNLEGVYTVAEPEPVAYATFFSELCKTLGVEARFLHIPYFAASLAIAAAKLLGKNLPVNRDTLLGLKSMIAQDSRRDLEKLGIHLRTWKESLQTLKGV